MDLRIGVEQMPGPLMFCLCIACIVHKVVAGYCGWTNVLSSCF